MTLNEAIERYTSNAEYERIYGSLQGCRDFRQLSEWLKDYKRLLEQEPKTGHWIKSNVPNEEYVCSECGGCCWYYDYQENVAKSRYCPNCGAKMESEDDNA